MHIIHIASELASIAKVGGLADVVLGLSRELIAKGHHVEVIIPKYDCLDLSHITQLEVFLEDLVSYDAGDTFLNTIWKGYVEDVPVYLVEPHHVQGFFERGCFYGCEDDIDRFLCFSRVAIEFLYKAWITPDILHLHDWHPAVIAPLYSEMYSKLGYTDPSVVLTIHNIEYQGKCTPENLSKIGLNGGDYLTEDLMQDNLQPELINLLKGGIVYSDFVTTVSPTYAWEVLEPTEGRGLETTLQQHQAKFMGILNGLDYSYWNPDLDRYIPVHYSLEKSHLEENLNKRAEVKNKLRSAMGLSQQNLPLIGCVTRLVPQKGTELIKAALHFAKKHQGQFLLLGSSPIPSITEEFQDLQKKYHHDPQIRIELEYKEKLAHLIFAGSDIIIVPSLFEPCGLTQLISLKYGAVPLVRRTGGLADTVFDVDDLQLPFEKKNGYTFDAPTVTGIHSALSRAFDCWNNDRDKWRKLMIQNTKWDYSWKDPADQYLDIYERVR